MHDKVLNLRMMCCIYVMCKVRIRTIRRFCCANLRSELLRNNPSIAHANLGSARNILGSPNQTSAIRSNKPTIDHARRAARPSASTKPQSIAHVCMHDRSWAGLLLWMAEVWLRIRGLPSKIRGSEVCVCDPRIILQSLDPRFAQQNPQDVRNPSGK